LTFCYDVKPVWLITCYLRKKQTNKQKKNIHRKCSHLLHTLNTESISHGWLHNSGGKNWFNIGGNSAIVTRYRLASQFHCSYLESRENAGNRGENEGNTRKKRGKLSPFHFRFRWRHFWWCNFWWLPVTSFPVISFPVTSLLHHPCSASNDTWMVLLYYSSCIGWIHLVLGPWRPRQRRHYSVNSTLYWLCYWPMGRRRHIFMESLWNIGTTYYQ
jgi:hypothetical protein